MSISTMPRPSPAYRSSDLLSAYLTGSFYFSSARGTLLADGVHARVDGAPGMRAPAVSEALDAAVADGVADPVVVGALSFRPDAEASLLVPAVVRRAGVPSAADTRVPAAPNGTGWSVRPQPAPDGYVDAVSRALEMIGDGELHKVALARGLELTAADPIDVTSLLARLVRTDATAYAFAADITAPGDPASRTLVGASPELLVARRGPFVVANPLAGSAPRAGDEAIDRERVDDLRDSGKDLGEHAYTSAQVAEVLSRFCTDLEVPDRPEVIGTPTMWHLSTRITGRLRDPEDPAHSALGLAEALHPTPAVGGVPADRVLPAIEALEAQDRGYYAGMVGWTGQDGDGEWALSIRSAEVCDRTARLFAGAGIVAGSDPRAELAETTAKFRTLLRAFGLEGLT